jgi:integrase
VTFQTDSKADKADPNKPTAAVDEARPRAHGPLPGHVIDAIVEAATCNRNPDRTPKQRRVPTAEELSTLLAVVSETRSPARNRALLLLASASTLRVSEILGLQWHDIRRTADGKHVVVQVQQKCGSLRTVTIDAAIIDVCFDSAFIAERDASLRKAGGNKQGGAKVPSSADPLFLTESGQPFSRYMADAMLARLCRFADCEGMSMHALRRWGLGVIKHQIDAASPDAKGLLAIIAGHATSSTTETYYVGPLVLMADRVPVARTMAANDDLPAIGQLAA